MSTGGNMRPIIRSQAGLCISGSRLTRMLKLDKIHRLNITNLIIVTGEVSESIKKSIAPIHVLDTTKTFNALNIYSQALDVLVLKSNACVNKDLK